MHGSPKKIIHFILDCGILFWGLLVFKFTGKNLKSAHQSLIRLFCVTRGRSSDFLSTFFKKPAPHKFPVVGALGSLSSENLKNICQEIREKGYCTFPAQLSPDVCEEILQFALNVPGLIRRMDSDDPSKWVQKETLFNREKPEAVRFDYQAATLVENQLIQKLVVDPSILALARSYLEAEPILDILTMWWHTSFGLVPDGEAAQYFHFDMDRLKWLKFFFYINDVSSENGPHTFVEGSHSSGSIPSTILNKGYIRLTDEEVQAAYPKEKFIEFTGRRGTIIVEDTRGLHKGKHVQKGDRLILQFEFANSLFGAKLTPIPRPRSPLAEWQKTEAEHPEIFSMMH